MELFSTAKLASSVIIFLAALLFNIVHLLTVGRCRTISGGTVVISLNCHWLPPLPITCWLHGQVDCLNHCSIFIALSKFRCLFTVIRPSASFKHSYSWGLKSAYVFALHSSSRIVSGLYGVTNPCTSCSILIMVELVNPSWSLAWVTSSSTGAFSSCRTLYFLKLIYL